MNDHDTINRISDRAERLAKDAGVRVERLTIILTIDAVNDLIGLDLERLEEADIGNFAHDVFGLLRHYNPMTDSIENGFYPRYASGEAA